MILLNYRPTLMILITSLKVLSTNIIARGDGASMWILFTTPSLLSPSPPGTPRSLDTQRIQPLSLDDLPQWHISVTASFSHTVLVTPDWAPGDSPSHEDAHPRIKSCPHHSSGCHPGWLQRMEDPAAELTSLQPGQPVDTPSPLVSIWRSFVVPHSSLWRLSTWDMS